MTKTTDRAEELLGDIISNAAYAQRLIASGQPVTKKVLAEMEEARDAISSATAKIEEAE